MISTLLIFSDWALFFLRLAVGMIFLFRGWQNLKNLKKNGGDFARINSKFIKASGITLILLEILGGSLIILGIYTQIIALFFALEMAAVAVWKMAKGHKFFGGYEFELLLVAANLILATMGGGFFAFLF